jgi:DNA-binding NtrC family response regulator
MRMSNLGWDYHRACRRRTTWIACAWPGNVRELSAVVERAAILGSGGPLEIATALGIGAAQTPYADANESSGGPDPRSDFPACDTGKVHPDIGRA